MNSNYGDLLGGLSKQLSNNLLPAGPDKTERADFRVTLKNGHKKRIDTEKIVYVEKLKDELPKIYFENHETLEFDETMSSIASRLQAVRPTILTTHKSFILNLSYINKKENDGNNYKVYSRPYPEKVLLVGQNHKTHFNTMIAQFGILLEN